MNNPLGYAVLVFFQYKEPSVLLPPVVVYEPQHSATPLAHLQ